MTKDNAKIAEILRRAEETLKTARHGLDDLVNEDKSRRFTGLRNLIVFGRSFTWVLQNLRSAIPESFDEWYKPEQEKMVMDPLMRYFIDARNELEKQGKLSVATNATIHSFSPHTDMKKFGRPPVGATSFFIGDSLGGTGWEVELADGKSEKYYVALLDSIGEVTQHFVNFPEAKAPELAGKSVDVICTLYLERLDALLERARHNFLDEQPREKIGSKQLPSYLRVVK
jgi:hypothetical protein